MASCRDDMPDLRAKVRGFAGHGDLAKALQSGMSNAARKPSLSDHSTAQGE